MSNLIHEQQAQISILRTEATALRYTWSSSPESSL